MNGDVKRIGTYLLWDLYMWLIVLGETFLYKFFKQQASRSFEMKYTYMMMFSTILTCILLGLGLAYLFSKNQALTKKDLILELCFVGIPALLFSFYAIPSGIEFIAGVQVLILMNMRLAFEIGGIIIGVELFKIINFVRREKVTQNEL